MSLYDNKHTTRTLKDRKGVPANPASTKSVVSKVKLVVTPPALVPRNKTNQKEVAQKHVPIPVSSKGRVPLAITKPAISVVDIQVNNTKANASKDKEVGDRCRAPPVTTTFTPKPVTKVITFSKIKGAFAKTSKIPVLKRESIQGDPFATHGDSFYADRRASISTKSKLPTKVAEPVHLVTVSTPAVVAHPIVKPIVNNLPPREAVCARPATIKERPAVFIPKAITSLPYNDDYPRPRKATGVSSDFDIVEVRRSTGLPAGFRVEAPVATDYTAKGPSTITTSTTEHTVSANLKSSKDKQLANFEDALNQLPISTEAAIVERSRESIFRKAKKGIKKSVKAIFRPCGGHKHHEVFDQVVVPYPNSRPDSASATAVPISPVNTEAKPKPKPLLPPARKPFGVRLSLPPVSGTKVPAARRSGHGICSLRRTGQSADSICICYNKIKKTRGKVPIYYPVTLSDLKEDVLVSIFPPRGEFKLDEAASYLAYVYVDTEADLPVKCVSHLPELVSGNSFVFPSVSNESVAEISSPVSQCISTSSSVSIFPEPVSLCSLLNVNQSLEPVVSVIDEPVDYVSVSSSYSSDSIIDQYLEPVASSPLSPYPLSILDEYFELAAPLSPQPCLVSTADIPDLSLDDSVSVSNALDENVKQSPSVNSLDATGGELELSESITPVSDSSCSPVISTPQDAIDHAEEQKPSKASKRCATILPSSAGLGLNVDTGIVPLDEHNLRVFNSFYGSTASPSPVNSSNASIGSPSTSTPSASPCRREMLMAHRAAICGNLLPISDQGIQAHRNAIYGGVPCRRHILPISPVASPIASSPLTCESSRSLADVNRAIVTHETRQSPTVRDTLRGFTHPTSLAGSPPLFPPPATPQRPQRSDRRTLAFYLRTPTHEELNRLIESTNIEVTLSYLPGYQRPPF